MVEKLPKNDPRYQQRSADRAVVDLEELRAFIAGKHRWILSTTRRDGRPQMSLVSGGMTEVGELAIASYPSRAKVKNATVEGSFRDLVLDRFAYQLLQHAEYPDRPCLDQARLVCGYCRHGKRQRID